MKPGTDSEKLGALQMEIRRLTRTTRFLTAALVATITLPLVSGADPVPQNTPVVRGSALQLVDDHGRVRAELAIDKEGAVGLFIRDEADRVRASVSHDESQSALFLNDEQGQVRVGITQFSHGGGGVALHGARGKGASVLYHKGKGSLAFYDGDGKVTTRVPSQ